MRPDMPRRSNSKSKEPATSNALVKGADLEPIDHVERELTSPDGTIVTVRVPVYPPFRLEQGEKRLLRASGKAPSRRSGGAKRKTG